MRLTAILLGTIATATSSLTSAIVPAMPEQHVCSAAYIATARVRELEVKPEQCFQRPEMYCQCDERMTIEIESVVAIKKSVLEYPEDTGIAPGKRVSIYARETKYPPAPVTPTSCQEFRSALIDQDHIFSIYIHYGLRVNGTLMQDRPPYYAISWPQEKYDWIVGVLTGPNRATCPSLVDKGKQ